MMDSAAPSPSIALAHHWLVGMRGGEKVLQQFCQLFPGAPIHTLVARPSELDEDIRRHPIHCSLLQHIGGAKRYKKMLPLFPFVVARMKIPRETQLLLSTDAAVIKGVALPEGIPHVCYCHSPPRYLWDMQDTYLQQTKGLGGFGRAVFQAVTPYVRNFDLSASRKVTEFIANSEFVRDRIARHYGRESVVIHPPVDVHLFDSTQPSEDFYLIISELVPYKRVDLAIDAFNKLGRRLVIIGAGSEMKALQARAGKNIEFLGRAPFAELKHHIERCRAFLYPQIEDFGITAVEVQAAGRPVIALRQGGALESVVEGQTGVFFDEQTVESLAEAVEKFESLQFDHTVCRANAERFRAEAFRERIRAFLVERFPSLFAHHPFPA